MKRENFIQESTNIYTKQALSLLHLFNCILFIHTFEYFLLLTLVKFYFSYRHSKEIPKMYLKTKFYKDRQNANSEKRQTNDELHSCILSSDFVMCCVGINKSPDLN